MSTNDFTAHNAPMALREISLRAPRQAPFDTDTYVEVVTAAINAALPEDCQYLPGPDEITAPVGVDVTINGTSINDADIEDVVRDLLETIDTDVLWV